MVIEDSLECQEGRKNNGKDKNTGKYQIFISSWVFQTMFDD